MNLPVSSFFHNTCSFICIHLPLRSSIFPIITGSTLLADLLCHVYWCSPLYFESANQKSPEDQTAQVTSTTEKIKVVGALLAGAGRVLGGVAEGAAREIGSQASDAVKDTVNDATTEPEIADKSGYETNQHNIKLGEESIPKKPNEEIV